MMPRATALAASLSLLLAGAGHGGIVYKQFQNIPIATTFVGTSVDLETGTWGNTDDLAGGDANFFFGGSGIGNDAEIAATVPTWQPVRIGTGSTDAVDNLALGATVDAGSTYATGFGGSTTHLGSTFTAGESGYLGFSLETTSGTAYGWMRVTLFDNQPGGIIHEWAYDDMSGSIDVGAIPEPGTAALAFAALAALAFRRKR